MTPKPPTPITIKLNGRQIKSVASLSAASNSTYSRLMLYLVSAGDASKATIPPDWGVTGFNAEKGTVTFGPPQESSDGTPTPEGS